MEYIYLLQLVVDLVAQVARGTLGPTEQQAALYAVIRHAHDLLAQDKFKSPPGGV